MKAEELFVGALVRVNRDGLCIKKDTIVEVRAVDADDKLIEKGLIGAVHCRPLDDNQFDGGIWCEYLDPIPLTPEILEKNGFARDEIAGWRFRQYEDGLGLIYEIYWNNKGDELEIVSNLAKIGGFDKKGIQFVHQLQHALRLCGIEKEITI